MTPSPAWLRFDAFAFEAMRLLLAALWQSSILFLAVALLAWTLRRRRPSARCALWIAALCLAPLLPLLASLAARVGAPQRPLQLLPTYPAPSPSLSPQPSAFSQSLSPTRSLSLSKGVEGIRHPFHPSPSSPSIRQTISPGLPPHPNLRDRRAGTPSSSTRSEPIDQITAASPSTRYRSACPSNGSVGAPPSAVGNLPSFSR